MSPWCRATLPATAIPETPAATASPVVMNLRREILLITSLRWWGSAAGDHGAHTISKSRNKDHQHVNQQEQHKEYRHEEMQAARRLLASQERDGQGEFRGEPEPHSQPCT